MSADQLSPTDVHDSHAHDPHHDGGHSAGNGITTMIETLRQLGPDHSLTAVHDAITYAARAELAGTTSAALLLPASHGRWRTVAATHDHATVLNTLQQQFHGPCLEATDNTTVIHSPDLRHERRWPRYTHALNTTPELDTPETGAPEPGTPAAGPPGRPRSLLSYLLYLRPDHRLGWLTLYADTPHAFTTDTIDRGHQFAAYAAAVLAHTHAHDQAAGRLHALESNREIGVAIGILMTRHLLTHDQALDRLRNTSQDRNRRLRDLAQNVILTGDLTPAPAHT